MTRRASSPLMRPLLDATTATLRAALSPGHGSCTRTFAEDVVRQVAHPLGAVPAPDRALTEARTAGDVLALLRGAFDGGAARAEAARRLAHEPVHLAAFFQNLDLLAECPRGHARAVAALVADALERSAAADE